LGSDLYSATEAEGIEEDERVERVLDAMLSSAADGIVVGTSSGA
jgi:hypothetical protein